MAPFGISARDVAKQAKDATQVGVERIFQTSLTTIGRLLPVFGGHWLAKEKPSTKDEQLNLLSMGMVYLTDIVVAEASRHVGFLLGVHNLDEQYLLLNTQRDWSELGSDVATRLMERVVSDWGIKSD